MYRCRICGREFETVPDQAVLLNSRGQSYIYRIDGVVHDLHRVMSAEAKHTRWHATPKAGCEFCFPSPVEPSPVEPLQEIEVQELLQPETKPEPEIKQSTPESEVPMTTMVVAFQKLKFKQKENT